MVGPIDNSTQTAAIQPRPNQQDRIVENPAPAPSAPISDSAPSNDTGNYQQTATTETSSGSDGGQWQWQGRGSLVDIKA